MANKNAILFVDVIDAEGNAMKARPVDAREIVAAGGKWASEAIPEKVKAEKQVHPAEKKKAKDK